MSEPPSGRLIFKRGAGGAVPALLQTLFAAEMLHPSERIWLVSPWVSDIVVLDNSIGGFRHLEPNWHLGPVTLARTLAALAERGTCVHVATRPARPWLKDDDAGRNNDRFIEKIRQSASDISSLYIHRKEEQYLHTKGLLGDGYFLSGSMNFTYSGVTLNDEQVRYTTDPGEVAHARLEFSDRWEEAP